MKNKIKTKVKCIRLWNFASFAYYLISLFKRLNNFLPEKHSPQPVGGRKCFLRVCQIPKHELLCYRNKLISYLQKSIIIVPILINKDVFEPRYNDLRASMWRSGKESTCQCRRCRFDPWARKIPGKGNGNPLQYSCLESPMDRGACWSTVHRVAKSQIWLKWHNTHSMIVVKVNVSVEN